MLSTCREVILYVDELRLFLIKIQVNTKPFPMKVAKLSNVQKIIWNACHPLEIPLLTSVGSICP